MANIPTPKEKVQGQDLSMHDAVRHKQIDSIQVLIESGYDINAKDENGMTPLIYAACRGHVECIKLLLDAGADVSITDNWGYDAYHTAMLHGDFKGVTVEPFATIMSLLKQA